MGAHINERGEFQSDKYPTCPAGKVPLSVKDPTAQDLLWEYAQRRRAVDAEFSDDLETSLLAAGYYVGLLRTAHYEDPVYCDGEKLKFARILVSLGLLEENPCGPGFFRRTEKGDAEIAKTSKA